MSTEQRQRCINKLNTATAHQHSNSEQPLTSASSEQPSYSEQPLTSIIHAPTNVSPDAGSQDITIGRFATGDEPSTTREERTLYVSLKDAVANTVTIHNC